MNKAEKILILYTSVGLGHKFIAQNIAFHLQRDGYEVMLHDVLQLQQGWLVDFGTWLHSLINRRFPFVWRWLYFSKAVNKITLPLRVPLAKSNSQKVFEVIEEFQPQAVICTQTTASATIASLKQQGKFHGKFVIAFSDYHLHYHWLYQGVDLYLVNIEEQKQEMISLGINPEKIKVCGITLEPKPKVDALQLKHKLGIPESNQVVLVGSGSLGIGFPRQLLESYLRAMTFKPNLSIIVACGKNTDLRQRLESLKHPNLIVLGFTDQLKNYYQVADLFLTKPGGLTIAESLQAGTKILITHTLPGQEEPNYEYLLRHGLVYPMPKPLNLANLLKATEAALTGPNYSETNESLMITHLGEEGKVLTSAINELFHGV